MPQKNAARKKALSFGNYEIVVPGNVSERRAVPSYIQKPEYAETGVPQTSPAEPEIKSKNQIECMIHSCMFAKRILREIRSDVKVMYRCFAITIDFHVCDILGFCFYSPALLLTSWMREFMK